MKYCLFLRDGIPFWREKVRQSHGGVGRFPKLACKVAQAIALFC